MSEKNKSVLKGLGIAMAGAGLAYLTQLTSGQDFGDFNLIVAALLGTAVNWLRKQAEST